MEKQPADISGILVRHARAEDEPHIREFTKNTFEWGDYVGDAFAEWLDGQHDVYVAEYGGIPIAVTCVSYPAAGEAWFQGIRVHPDYRKMGIGRKLTEASIDGARKRGVRVCRAMIDSDNVKSQGLAKAMGFRQAAKILEFVVTLPRIESPRVEGVQGSGQLDLTVSRAAPDEINPLVNLASGEIRYLGSEWVYVSLTEENFKRVASESTVLVARDASGRPVAGGIMGEIFEDDGEHGHTEGDTRRLDSGVGSLFGSARGIEAIVNHAASMVEGEALTKGFQPGKLYLGAEQESPAVERVLRYIRKAAGDRTEPDYTVLWELTLE